MHEKEKIELVTPDLGDAEKIELVGWNVSEGASVEEGDELLELVTDKAAFPVESPCSGRITEIRIKQGIVKKGQILGILSIE